MGKIRALLIAVLGVALLLLIALLVISLARTSLLLLLLVLGVASFLFLRVERLRRMGLALFPFLLLAPLIIVLAMSQNFAGASYEFMHPQSLGILVYRDGKGSETPYLLATDPSGARIILYNPQGQELGQVDFNHQKGMKAPAGIGVHPKENRFYVADPAASLVWKFRLSKEEGELKPIPEGALSPEDGFQQPAGVAVDEKGRVYVADTRNHRIVAFKENSLKEKLMEPFGSSGSDEKDHKQFHYPQDIDVTTIGNTTYLLVADTENNKVKWFALEEKVEKKGGKEEKKVSIGSMGVCASVHKPYGLDVDGKLVAVASTLEGKIHVFEFDGKKCTQKTVFDFPREGTYKPRIMDVAVYKGTVYAADAGRGSIRILKLAKDKLVPAGEWNAPPQIGVTGASFTGFYYVVLLATMLAWAFLVLFHAAFILVVWNGGDRRRIFTHMMALLITAVPILRRINFLNQYFRGAQVIRDGKVIYPPDAPPRALGPGYVVVDTGSAAVLERAGRITRIVGPSTVTTEPYEYMRGAVDLRLKNRTIKLENVLTKDSIPLEMEVTVFYRIPLDQHSLLRRSPPEFRFNTSNVLRALYNAEDWEEATEKAVRSAVYDVVSRYSLDELISVPRAEDLLHRRGKEPEPRRDELGERIRQVANGATGEWGVEVKDVRVEAIVLPQEVLERMFERWRAMWEEMIAEGMARGEAERIRQIEEARAQALATLIGNIAASLREAGVSEERVPRSLLLLRIIEALEKAAQEPTVKIWLPDGILKMLEDFRKEIGE